MRRASHTKLAKLLATKPHFVPNNHVRRYRTQLCNDGIHCKRKVCFFAHTLEELRCANVKVVSAEAARAGIDISEEEFLRPVHADPFRSCPSPPSTHSPVSPLSPRLWDSPNPNTNHKQQQQQPPLSPQAQQPHQQRGGLLQPQHSWPGTCGPQASRALKFELARLRPRPAWQTALERRQERFENQS